jgi:hypothetical protein
MQPYSKILRQALEITRTTKILWLYGLLLILGHLLNIAFSLSNRDLFEQLGVPRNPWFFIVGLAVICLLLLIYYRAKAGMILALKVVMDKKPVFFSVSFALARLFVIRLLWLSIMMQLILFLLTSIISTPIFYLFSNNLVNRGIVLLIFGIIVFLPFAFIIWMVNVFGPLFMVTFNLSLLTAIKNCINLIGQFWSKLLRQAAIVALIFLGGVLISAVMSSPVVILGLIAYYNEGLILSYALFFLGSIVFLMTLTLVTVFIQTAWFLTFMDLVKPQKFEEEKVLPEPEVAA